MMIFSSVMVFWTTFLTTEVGDLQVCRHPTTKIDDSDDFSFIPAMTISD